MSNANLSNKNLVASFAGVNFNPIPSGGSNPIPTGFPGFYADANGNLQAVDALGNISPLSGESVLNLTAGGTVAAGNFCYVNTSGQAVPAQANASTTVPAVCVALAAVASSATGNFQTSGIYTTTGLTRGSYYYLSAATPGAITATAPTQFGQYLQPIGLALSTTQLLLQPAAAVGLGGRNVGAALTSGSTIVPTDAIHHVTGTAAVVNITAPANFTAGGTIILIPDGAFTTTNAGNIAIASTAVVSKALHMTYDAGTSKWYPSY